jgi:hypothetical protein
MSRQAKIIVGAVIAVLLLSTVGAVIFLGKADSPSKAEVETVRIEVRSMPAMTIQKDGKKLGQTPLSFQVRKSTTPLSLDAAWTEQRIYRTGAKMIPRQAHKDVVPDHDMTVDFTRADGKPVQMDKIDDPTE